MERGRKESSKRLNFLRKEMRGGSSVFPHHVVFLGELQQRATENSASLGWLPQNSQTSLLVQTKWTTQLEVVLMNNPWLLMLVSKDEKP
jgi:hypothetical protein